MSMSMSNLPCQVNVECTKLLDTMFNVSSATGWGGVSPMISFEEKKRGERRPCSGHVKYVALIPRQGRKRNRKRKDDVAEVREKKGKE